MNNMEDAKEQDYQGWPNRIYISGIDDKIANSGAKRPQGFKLEEARNP